MSDFEPKTLTLGTPVKIGESGDEVKELVFSRPLKAKDFKGMPLELGMDQQHQLIARLTGQPLPVILELRARDMMAAMAVLSDFL